MPDFFCNSFETPLLPGSFLKFWDLGALGNCLTRLREGPALGGGLVLMGSRPSRCLCNYNKYIYIYIYIYIVWVSYMRLDVAFC